MKRCKWCKKRLWFWQLYGTADMHVYCDYEWTKEETKEKVEDLRRIRNIIMKFTDEKESRLMRDLTG